MSGFIRPLQQALLALSTKRTPFHLQTSRQFSLAISTPELTPGRLTSFSPITSGFLFWVYSRGADSTKCASWTYEDIAQEEEAKIWFIRITDDHKDKPFSKSVKNRSSHRLLPIHDELIRAGFICFVEQARAEGRNKLFSDGLTYNATKGWGGNATTFFTRFPSASTKQGGYFFNLGIRKRLANGRPDNKKFHSFRHTFIDLLTNTGGEAKALLETFTGHAKENKTQTDDYGIGVHLQNKHDALHSVKFPAHLSRITYVDFKDRLGNKLDASIAAHRQKHGLNQVER